MNDGVRVFISSTWLDLQTERKAVEQALHRMQDTAFAGMEYFGSRPETPRDASLAEVARSDIYVGIFAHRYGSGITEAEYREARRRGLPCLIYLKDEGVPVTPAQVEREPGQVAKLEALKRELKRHHTISFFNSPDHLASQVVADLHNCLAGERPAGSPPATRYQITLNNAQGVVIGDGAQVRQVFHAERRGPGEAERLPASQEQRCADLGENIRETLALITQYEEQRRLTDDPRTKRRAEREIVDLKRQLSGYQAEARELGCDDG
jgi:hypothetical protein